MIKMGIIGSGSIVATVLTEMSKFNEIELTACYSRDITKANQLKEKFNIKFAYDHLESMMQSDINTVYIASVNSLHYTQAKLALLHNKHVICEKPFTTNLAELEELKEIAKEKNLNLFEAIPSKYLPTNQIIKESLSKIGKIKNVIINFSQYSSKYPDYINNIHIANVFKAEFSGGTLADLGIYNLSFLTELFGFPNEAQYIGNINSYGVDLSGVGILKYDDFIASFTCAKDCSSKNFVLIQGDNGHLYLDNVVQNAKNLEIRINQEIQTIPITLEHSIYHYEIKHFINHFNQLDQELNESIRLIELFEKLKKNANIKDCYNYK